MQGFYPYARGAARIRPETGRLRIPLFDPHSEMFLVGDPRLALSLCLFPKQVGRCLPMSPIVVAGLRVARSLRAYETREATAPALPQGLVVDSEGFEPPTSAF